MDLSLDRIAEASRTVDPVFLRTPQYADALLGAALGRHVVVKVETANPLRSFKGRGADFLMSQLAPGPTVVCSSTGNFGQAVAYAGRRRNRSVEIFVPENVNPAKLARMRAFGARVTLAGHDSAAADDAAREYVAGTSDRILVEDGRDTAIAEGAGTIGVEMLASGPFDAIVVPVGDGALIAGVALWVKAHAPATRIVGVCARGRQAWPRAGGRAGRCRRRRRAPLPKASRSVCPCPNPSRGSSSSSTIWCWSTTTTCCRRCASRWTRSGWFSSHPAPRGWPRSRGSWSRESVWRRC